MSLTPKEHRAEAIRLLQWSRKYRKAASNPNAAGSNIRSKWEKRADVLLAESQIHASLGVEHEGEQK